jgi:hypothetical protein
MLKIRKFEIKDYEIIKAWWKHWRQKVPTLAMLPMDSTFILEENLKPQMCVTVYLTNGSQVWVDNLVRDPLVSKKLGHEMTEKLQAFIEAFSRELGYTGMFCFSEKGKLQQYYGKLGYKPTLEGVVTFLKEI